MRRLQIAARGKQAHFLLLFYCGNLLWFLNKTLKPYAREISFCRGSWGQRTLPSLNLVCSQGAAHRAASTSHLNSSTQPTILLLSKGVQGNFDFMTYKREGNTDRFIQACFLNALPRNTGSDFACGSIELIDKSKLSLEIPDYRMAYTHINCIRCRFLRHLCRSKGGETENR